MNEATPYIGVDVSKTTLDYFIPGERKARRCENTPGGAASLARAALKRGFGVCCEPTGGYERKLLEACWGGGVPVATADAWRVRHFAKGRGVLEKTDAIDARVIAAFAAQNEMRPIPRPTCAQRELRELTRAIETLDRQIQISQGQLEHDGACGLVRKTVKAVLRCLQAERARLDGRRLAVVRGDDRMHSLFVRYQRVKGIGPATALAMIAEMPELGTVSDKGAAKLIGTAPIPNESGKKTGARAIQRGRFGARSALYMAALVATRHNPILKGFYRRLVDGNGKPRKVAIVAVMRKLVCLLNRIASDESFEPSPAASKSRPVN